MSASWPARLPLGALVTLVLGACIPSGERCASGCPEARCVMAPSAPVTLLVSASDGRPVYDVQVTGAGEVPCRDSEGARIAVCEVLPVGEQCGAGLYSLSISAAGLAPVQLEVEVEPDPTPSCCEGPYRAKVLEVLLSPQ